MMCLSGKTPVKWNGSPSVGGMALFRDNCASWRPVEGHWPLLSLTLSEDLPGAETASSLLVSSLSFSLATDSNFTRAAMSDMDADPFH